MPIAHTAGPSAAARPNDAPTARLFAWTPGGAEIPASRFRADVAAVAARLPDRHHAINLCEDRYLFTVAFVAAACRGHASLLPASRAPEDVERAAGTFGPDYRLRDDRLAEWIEEVREGGPVGGGGWTAAAGDPLAAIPPDLVVAVPFTSGSTGLPQPHPKRWGDLVAGAWLAERRFGFAREGVSGIVATVPPQHMYGLETSVMVPLVVGTPVHGGRPFFPADIRLALAEAGPRPVLVTTPVHLAACLQAGLEWPRPAFVVSATAPLAVEVAERAEAALGAPVLEIFGCTEAGSIASRRTVRDPDWWLYDGVVIRDSQVEAEHLPEPVPMNDVVEARGPDRFALVGRAADLVNVAGKRTSLAHLNRTLCAIPGVEDGAFVLPEEEEEGGGRAVRLAAAIVAPGLRPPEVLAALASRVDPLFMPRPLLMVDRLPRNDNGKLPRRALLDLLRRASAQRTAGKRLP